MVTRFQKQLIEDTFKNHPDYLEWFKKNYNKRLRIPYSRKLLLSEAKNIDWFFKVIYPVFSRAEQRKAVCEAKAILNRESDLNERLRLIKLMNECNYLYQSAERREFLRQIIH